LSYSPKVSSSPPTLVPSKEIFCEKTVALSISLVALISGCSQITTERESKTVIIYNPWFFGHGGVRDETQKPGLFWYRWSTRGVSVALTPTKYNDPR